jgi:hypothetical protein
MGAEQGRHRFRAIGRFQPSSAWRHGTHLKGSSPFPDDAQANAPLIGNGYFGFISHGSYQIAAENNGPSPVFHRPGNRAITEIPHLHRAAKLAKEELAAPGAWRRVRAEGECHLLRFDRIMNIPQSAPEARDAQRKAFPLDSFGFSPSAKRNLAVRQFA